MDKGTSELAANNYLWQRLYFSFHAQLLNKLPYKLTLRFLKDIAILLVRQAK